MSNENEQKPDHRGSEEINKLADVLMTRLREYLTHEAVESMGFIREVYVIPRLVDAYAKGVEIGGEYARKEGYEEGFSAGQRDVIDGGGP